MSKGPELSPELEKFVYEQRDRILSMKDHKMFMFKLVDLLRETVRAGMDEGKRWESAYRTLFDDEIQLRAWAHLWKKAAKDFKARAEAAEARLAEMDAHTNKIGIECPACGEGFSGEPEALLGLIKDGCPLCQAPAIFVKAATEENRE